MNTPKAVWTLDSKQAWLSEVWRYRELFFFMVWRDLKVRYKQSVLGVLWAVIQPVATMVIFTVFFGKLAGMEDRTGDIPYPLFTFAALLPWTYFSTSFTATGNCLVGNVDLITKVYFPRIVIPAASVMSGLVDFAIATVVLLLLMFGYGFVPAWGFLLWPLFMIPVVFLALSLGMILAVLNVRYRDVKHTIPFFVQLLLFLTPVIYPADLVTEQFQVLYSMNPLVGAIEGMRASLLGTASIDFVSLGQSYGVSVCALLFAVWFFRRSEETFADVI